MAKCTFIMWKVQSRLQPCGPAQERLYAAWLDGLKEGQVLEVSAKKHRPAKTQKQLGYWFDKLLPFAVEALRSEGHHELFEVSVGNLKTGVETNKVTVDLLFKTLLMASRSEKRLPLKRNMTDEEMGQLIDFSLDWLARNLGVTAPLPKKPVQDPPTKEQYERAQADKMADKKILEFKAMLKAAGT